jgi:hypothetical protein
VRDDVTDRVLPPRKELPELLLDDASDELDFDVLKHKSNCFCAENWIEPIEPLKRLPSLDPARTMLGVLHLGRRFPRQRTREDSTYG